MVRKFALVLGLSAAASWVACTPNIPQVAPAKVVVAQYDLAATPPVVPAPNDLAFDAGSGLLDVPNLPTQSTAEQAYNDYLNTLDGFPTASVASLTFSGALDAGSVVPGSVFIVDTTNPAAMFTVPAASVTWVPAPPQIGTVAVTNEIQIVAGWQKAHQYGIAVIGGANGLAGATGLPVVASSQFALLRQSSSLVTCTGGTCVSALSPSVLSDSQAAQLEPIRLSLKPTLDFLANQGVDRKAVVSAWTFHTTSQGLVSFNVDAVNPPASTIPFPSDFLMASADGGFPSFTGGAAHVNLPIVLLPDGGLVLGPDGGIIGDTLLTAALKGGLNTLDGFSTTASIRTTAVGTGPAADTEIDATTLAASQFVLVNTANPAEIVPVTVTCNGACSLTNPTAEPDEVAFKPSVPLRSNTRYAVLWLKGGHTATTPASVLNANPVFAFARLNTALVDSNGTSQISAIDNATAAQLEQLRQIMSLPMGIGDAEGINRADVLLAWTFVTQTTSPFGAKLHDYPYEVNAQIYQASSHTQTLPTAVVSGPNAWPEFGTVATVLPATFIGSALEGSFISLNVLDPNGVEANLLTGGPQPTEGTFLPSTFASPRFETRTFILFTPSEARLTTLAQGTPTGFPVPILVFQHGINGFRRQAVATANIAAAFGFATLAIDNPLHGDRSLCHQDSDCSCPDGGVGCSNINEGDPRICGSSVPASGTPSIFGRCVDAADLPGAIVYAYPYACTGPADLNCLFQEPKLSGNQFLSPTNIFATRDHFRQQIVDFGQMMRSIGDISSGIGSVTDPGWANGEHLDPTHIVYMGQSLGGIMGGFLAATTPEMGATVLNVPGASLTDLLLTSPSPGFQALAGALNNFLTAQGLPVGSEGYENFLDTARWILDPSDPQNYARNLYAEPLADTLPGTVCALGTFPGCGDGGIFPAKDVFVSWTTNDQVVSNYTTSLLLNALPPSDAGFLDPQSFVPYDSEHLLLSDGGEGGPASAPLADGGLPGDHTFLNDWGRDPNLAIKAQTDAMSWLSQ